MLRDSPKVHSLGEAGQKFQPTSHSLNPLLLLFGRTQFWSPSSASLPSVPGSWELKELVDGREKSEVEPIWGLRFRGTEKPGKRLP